MDVNSALSSLVYSGETVSSYDLGQAVLATASCEDSDRRRSRTVGSETRGVVGDYIDLSPSLADVSPPRTPHPNDIVSLADSYAARQDRFHSSVNEALQNEELSFVSRRYLKGLTQGELLKAAQAYEHLRPDLWPFNSVRKFDALKHNNWMRLARAAMFIELERKRLSSVEDFDQEAYDDANHEITRLQNKAIEQRWPSGPQEEEMDPF